MPLKGRKACFTPQFLRKTSPITDGFQRNQLQKYRKPVKMAPRRRYDPIRRFRFLEFFPEPAAYRITHNRKSHKRTLIISKHKPDKVKMSRLRRPKSAVDPPTRERLKRSKLKSREQLTSPVSKKKGKAKYTPLFFKFAPTVKKTHQKASVKPEEYKITRYQPVVRVNIPEALKRRCRPKTAKTRRRKAERAQQNRQRSKSDIRSRKKRCKSAGQLRATTLKKTFDSGVDRRYRMHRTPPDSYIERKKPKKAAYVPLWHKNYDWLKEAKRKIDDRQRKEVLLRSIEAFEKDQTILRTKEKATPAKQGCEPWQYGDKLLTQLKPRTAYPVVSQTQSSFCDTRTRNKLVSKKDTVYLTRVKATSKKR